MIVINKDNIDMLLRKYGRDSDVARVRIYGDFPKGALDSFISMETVDYAMKTEFDKNYFSDVKILNLGVDVARFGDDSTVLSPKIGDYWFDVEKYSKQDTMVTVGRIIQCCKKYMKKYSNIKKCIVKVDDTGVGGGVTDRLKEVIREEHLPIKVIPINNGESADDDYYFNLGAELWGSLKVVLEDNMSNVLQGKPPLIHLPRNDELIKQLSNRKYKITSKGKIQLESKEDMKKRGLGSPDIADAVVLANYSSGWL